MTEASSPAHMPLACIQVSANCSLSPRGAILFFGVVAGGSLTIAVLFASVGMWPVLPFAGLELFLLGLALGLSVRQGRDSETITLAQDRVVVERHRHGGRESREFVRLWARVELQRAPRSGHPSRLVILSHGQSMEVGRVLTEPARQDLYRRLAELIGRTGQAPDIWPAEQAREKQSGNGVGIDVQQQD
jgi:uncharacterized membrane protein